MSEKNQRAWVKPAIWVLIAVLGLGAPIVLGTYWVQLGALVFATAIGAIGLMLLFGRLGQLSLGHAFFLAIGAYSYVLLASPPEDGGYWGVGLPSIVALVVAVAVSAVAGLLLSPLAARLKGLSLGLATMALTFIGVWLLYSLEDLTGGYNGRGVPALTLGPLSSLGSNVAIGGVQITAQRFVWYAGFIALIIVILFTRNILGKRIGRAFTAVRDADIHAGALGVNVGQTRAVAFIVSSAFAGLAGVLLAINIQRLVPEYWGLMLSLSYLAMIVIGGMRSIGGAMLGALIVTGLPSVLQRYGQSIPGVGSEGGGGLGPAVTAQVIYGLVVIVVLIVQPLGLIKLLGDGARWIRGRFSGRRTESTEPARQSVEQTQ